MKTTINNSVIDCSTLQQDRTVETDVLVIGTGAGGGISAMILAEAGYKVMLVDEGPYRTTADFHMQEAEAYPDLYQEVANRKTSDKAITILQGRTVGGGTTVNWTSCFHIPPQTLAHWRQQYGWTLDEPTLAPAYKTAEQLLGIAPWPQRNPSNAAFARGAGKLGWHHETISRNVRGCRNLGYCGVGCPVGAKQSTLVACIPRALRRGASLYSRLRVQRLVTTNDRVGEVECQAMNARGSDTTGIRVRIRARHVVLAAGGIGSPALLLGSGIPDLSRRVGKRTFLHVTVASAAVMPGKVEPYYGAPQSVHSNEFVWRDGITGEMGYKIEAAPLHPALAATVFGDHGQAHAEVMQQIPYVQPLIALTRDGFNEHSRGGTVRLASDGYPVLDYPLNDYYWRAFRRAYASLMEVQFAAGAKKVFPVHSEASWYSSWAQARKALAELPMAAHRPKLFSAHVMGGCMMGSDADSSVTNLDGRHHQLRNLSIIDGSLFPTSIGANPSLPIYAIAVLLSQKLASTLRQ